MVRGTSAPHGTGWRVIGLLLATIFMTCRAQNEDISAICQGAQNCGECMLVNPSCAWCATAEYVNQRCDSAQSLQNGGCLNITNPQAIQTKLEDVELSNAGADKGQAVQVKPQRMSITVRPRETTTVRLQVRQAEDYPVDLYYAMDLSHSMKDDLANLKGLGTTLAQKMAEITSDYRLGFGSFVDKTVLPYVSTVPSKLISPCSGCASPHGFHNVLPLNSNSDLFTNKITDTTVSGNLDTPEGGFDALMQIAVCQDEIGWRSNARHLVVFTTDASFHFAGDGRLGGIVEPNDGRCHMDPNTNMYNMSAYQDYPSIGHLSAKLRENNVIPIFAVTNDQSPLYYGLENYIEGATVGVLAEDSSNVVTLIQENYELITSKVQLTSTAPDDVTLSYTAHCLNNQTFPDSKACDGLTLGDTVAFDIDITAQGCVDNGRTSFTIGPVGFNEELTIELEVTCACDCEGQGEVNSSFCSNGNGTLECGECVCNEGRYGSNCECSGSEISLESSDAAASCRQDNSSVVCSGRGECICGQCVCEKRRDASEIISGRYCECDNFQCPNYRGQRCGGESRGECVCDVATREPRCLCKPGYEGPSCECPTRMDACRAANGLVCNALGTCECGVCKCDPDSQYQGTTCEVCATCPLGQCHVHRDCVQCKMFGTGRLTPEQCDMCTIDIVNVTDVTPYLTLTPEGTPCTFTDDNDTCTFTFAIHQVNETETYIVYVENDKRCPVTDQERILTDAEIRWLVIGIILGIVIIGMILVLAWRLYTYLEDKREFAQWQKECEKASWDKSDNPIYKSSTTTFQNPVYGK